MQKVFGKIKEWGKDNALILIYFVFSIVIEMTAVFVVEGTPFLSRPFLSLGLLIFICGVILMVKNNYARVVICTVMLALQAVLDLVFAVIFDMTDQYFDLGMLSLRNDAFAILENVPVDFITFYVGMAVCVFFVIFGLRFAYCRSHAYRPKRSIFFYIGLMVAGLATLCTSYLVYYPRTSKDKYDEMINGKSLSAYSGYGMIGNLLGEVGQEIFQDRTPLPDEEINTFVYSQESQPTAYFGISKGKNVLTILGESLEWYTFLRGDDPNMSFAGEYPNALDIPQEVLEILYPNLTEFYNESVVMTNFHGREKTDIAETISIVGSYPTGEYINYKYEHNTIPYTLPNMLKIEEGAENISVRSFHNGFKSFYNRAEAHQALGFVELTDMNDMEEMSNEMEELGYPETFHDYAQGDKGSSERNLDSQMVTTAHELMFPTDKRFYTYITTITMHGRYSERKNLTPEKNEPLAVQLDMLEQYRPEDEDPDDTDSAEQLFYYMQAGLEFDRMLGCIKEQLTSKVYPAGHEKAGQTLWDNTTILLFGDHNAYYENLSNYVKGIEDRKDDEKFTDLYNVPLMIRDADLVEAVQENGGERIIDKFTCTADIVPTLLDILGIKYFSNMYYGHSVFSTEQSVLYSRAYDIFLGDGILRRSVKGAYYQYDGLTETGVPVKDTVAAFEKEGTNLVEKIKYCDYIFKQDHFGEKVYYNEFHSKMKTLNGWN